MQSEASGARADRDRIKARILVVDDDGRNLLAISQVLADTAEVVTAASGKDALRLLLTQDFAVVLLDVFMPGMDGYEVASLIRERQQTARIPIIFLSAVNKETEHLMRGYAMGAVDYVFKPVDPLVLRSKVSVFVDLYEMRAQIEEKSRAERELREANFKAQLDRLQMQRELDESRAVQAAIINSLPIVLYLEQESEAARTPQFVGGKFEALTGYPFEAIEANPLLWTERLHPDDADGALAALDERRKTGQMAMEFRWKCASGQYRHFLDQAVLLPGSDGHVAQYAGTLIDVTERKQLEAQLLQAGKLEAIGQLTGGVAHDFNNLLATVLGGINLLERRMTFPAREQSVIDHMRHAAENGATLVRRMMAFARKQVLHPKVVTPDSLRQSVLGLVEPTLGGTVHIEWSHCEASQNLLVDEAQLELAVVNLIINARDAMPSGGRIRITCADIPASEASEHGLHPQGYVRVSVEDEGGGIPEEHLDRIVEPFFTTKEVGKGTGLGLSMVAGFAQQSGGKLTIESRVQVGTTIHLLLPGTPEAPSLGTAAECPTVPTGPCGRSVLLVDDDESVREILGAQLEELGMTVTRVDCGARALEVLSKPDRSFDILLSDFAMPGINGCDTIKHALALHPQLHPILMTGYADDRLLRQGQTVCTVVRKPIDLSQLQQAMNTVGMVNNQDTLTLASSDGKV